MINAQNFLLIAGGGQNVGKTTLVCDLIHRFSVYHEVVAIKMSSHMHNIYEGAQYVAQTDDYAIVRETDIDLDKDSGKMLRAGAQEVYYIQAKPDSLSGIVTTIIKLVGDRLCICESGSLQQFIKPSVFLYLTAEGKVAKDARKDYADIVLADFDFEKLKIRVENNVWKLG